MSVKSLRSNGTSTVPWMSRHQKAQPRYVLMLECRFQDVVQQLQFLTRRSVPIVHRGVAYLHAQFLVLLYHLVERHVIEELLKDNVSEQTLGSLVLLVIIVA